MPTSPFSAALVTLLCWSAAAWAQPTAEVSAAAKSETASVLAGARLRYGVALHSGSQQDLGPGVSYSGLTPNDVGLSAWYFGARFFGAALGFQREGFSLKDDANAEVTSGALIRAHVGPTARVAAGPLRFEGLVAYQLAQLPGFRSSSDPGFSAATRHGVLLAARAMVDVGPFTGELRGELPLAVSARDGAGAPAGSTGFAVGAAAGLSLGRVDQLGYGVVVDYQLVSDTFRSEPSLVNTQTISRVGLALELKWLDPAPLSSKPRFGSMQISLTDAETGEAMGNAELELIDTSQSRHLLTTDASGVASVDGLPPGVTVVRSTPEGYLPTEGSGAVRPGQSASLELRARKQGQKVGSLVVRAIDKEGGAPLPGATVKLTDNEYLTDESGTVTLEDLPPGPRSIQVRLKGYRPMEEVASVAAGRSSEVTVSLLKEERKALATLTGLVRSTAGGAPIAAELELPQVKAKTRANAQGAFVFRVEAGTYTIHISAPGYVRQTKSVTIKDGDQAIFNVDLYPR